MCRVSTARALSGCDLDDRYLRGACAQVDYRDGVLIGHRLERTQRVEPLCTFGHGLAMGPRPGPTPRCQRPMSRVGDSATVSVTITTRGDRRTSNVVQVCLHDKVGVVVRQRCQMAGASCRVLARAATTGVRSRCR